MLWREHLHMAEKAITQVLADNLRFFMTEKGLTQAQLAKASGLAGQRSIQPNSRRLPANHSPPSAGFFSSFF